MLLSSLIIILVYVLGLFNLKAPISKKIAIKKSRSGLTKTVKLSLFDRILIFFGLEWKYLWLTGVRFKDGKTDISVPWYLTPFIEAHTIVNRSWKPIWKPRTFVMIIAALVLLVIAVKLTPLAAIPIFFLPLISEEVAELRKAEFLTTSPREWNGDNDSLQAITDKIDGIAPSDFGTKYYVDIATGSDTNSGTSPYLPFKTIGKAFLTITDGDSILVSSGSYTEAGLDLTNDYIKLILEQGVVIRPVTSTALVISGGFNTLIGGLIQGTAGHIGLQVTGQNNKISDINGTGTISFVTSGSSNKFYRLTSINATLASIDVDVGADNCLFVHCNSFGTPGVHYNIEGGDNCQFVDCHAGGINAWNIDAGINDTKITDCSGYDEVTDAGTDTQIENYTIGSQISPGQSRDQDLKDIYDIISSGGADVYWGTLTTMVASTTTLECTGLSGYGDDTFNDKYYIYIIKNNNSVGNAPENEYRLVTDYVSATGSFTINPLTANAEVDDIILLIHKVHIETWERGDQTYSQVNAIQTLQETGDTLTADGTEQNVHIENTPLGVMKPRYIKVDFENMVAGDVVRMRIYERLNTGGSMDVIYDKQFTGVDGGLPDGGKHWIEKLPDNRFGYQVTLQQLFGTYRDFDHEVTTEA